MQHFHLDHHFRLGLVDVINHLSREQYFVRRVAHDKGVLRIELLDALQVQQLPQSGNDFRQLLRRHSVRQIKRLHHFFFIIPALLRLIRNYENDVFRHRLPEGLALQRGDLQRLLQGYIVQFHGDSSRGEVRIVNHGESRPFSNGVKNDLRVVRHFHIDRPAGKRLDLRQCSGKRRLIGIGGWCGGGIALAVLLRDHFDRFVQFLFSDGARRIDHLRSLEFSCGALQIALFPEL